MSMFFGSKIYAPRPPITSGIPVDVPSYYRNHDNGMILDTDSQSKHRRTPNTQSTRNQPPALYDMANKKEGPFFTTFLPANPLLGMPHKDMQTLPDYKGPFIEIYVFSPYQKRTPATFSYGPTRF